MTRFFNGKELARQKETGLTKEIKELGNKGIKPKLVSILVGDDPSGKLYLRLKKEAAERVGIELVIKNFPSSIRTNELIHWYKIMGKDVAVNGLMLQLPLPEKFSKEDRNEIINSIDSKKDVDGMRSDSPFVAPVVLAVGTAFEEALNLIPLKTPSLKVVVVGHKGFEGGKIYRALQDWDLKWNFSVEGVDIGTQNAGRKTRDADILISATGKPNLIKSDMVKDGVVLIDVGSPKGDIDKKAYKKTSFVSPVPGGIGPLTVTYLMQNLVESAHRV